MDVTDPDSITALINIANSQNLGACPGLATSSFVPSMVNTSAVGCSLPSGTATINPTTCTNIADFSSDAAACRGCVDSSLIFNSWYTALGQGGWKTLLDNKYTAVACKTPWTDYFGNVWDNYYQIKTSKFVGISNRWDQVSNSANLGSDISIITGNLGSINSTMTSVIGTLQGAFAAIIDPQYGMIAGLNCQLIGEDLQLVTGSICVSNFNTLYITRLLMGIAAFGILFAMCCIVCSGVRHFKHSERKDRVSPNFMGDKNSFEHTDAAFRP